MMNWFLLLKFIHILSAILMIGGSTANGIMELNLKSKKKMAESDTIFIIMSQVKLINNRIVLPSIISLLITGLLFVFVYNYPITILWILTSLLLMILVFTFYFIGKKYEDRLQKEANDNAKSNKIEKTHKMIKIIGFSASLVILFILFLMIVKPI